MARISDGTGGAVIEDDADPTEAGGDGETGPGGDGGILESLFVVGQEIRRSSANAVAVDVLYVFTMAFFATLAVRGLWPAIIAAVPVVVLLAFAWMSSRLFLIANLVTIAAAVVATWAGLVPL